MFKNCGTAAEGVTCMRGILEGEERDKGAEKAFTATMTELSPNQCQTSHTPGSPENKDKCQKSDTYVYYIETPGVRGKTS